MVITPKNIRKIFSELDAQMSLKNRDEHIVIFGSAALMTLGFSKGTRTTRDVDVVEPVFDNEMWLMSAETGEKFELEMGWLNTAGNIFSRNFPEGWKERTKEVFKGESLRVSSLGRIDLIHTKFNALCDRGLETDLEDLVGLSPKKFEIEKAKSWVIGQKSEMTERAQEAEKELFSVMNRSFGRGR